MNGRVLAVTSLLFMAGATVQGNWFAEQWNTFSSSSFWATTYQLFNKALTTLKQRFQNLSDDVKGWLTNKSFSNATVTQLLNKIPADGWREIHPALLMTAKKKEVTNLIAMGTGKVPQRFLDELDRLTLLNMTNDEIISLAQYDISQLTVSEAVTLVSRLGDPAKWSPQNVTDLGPVIFQLPVCLDKVQNDSTAQAVMEILIMCQSANPDPNCPHVEHLWTLTQMMVQRLKGPPSTWNKDTVRAMGNVSIIPDYAIVYLTNSFVKDKKADIVSVPIPATRFRTCENWKQALCRTEQCTVMTAAADNIWYNSLANLQVCVGPSDLSPAGLADPTLKAIAYTNSKARGKDINPQDARIILDDALMNKTVDTITKSDVDALGGPLMMRAPACYLKAAAKRRLLNTVLPSMDSSIMMVQGPEFSTKINALMKADMDTTFINGVFYLSLLSDSLKTYISPNLLKDQNKANWKLIVDKAQETRQRLTTYQIDVIMSQLTTTELLPYTPLFKEYASTRKIEGLDPTTLAMLSKNMSPFSLPCLRGAYLIFGGTNNISAEVIRQGMDFLPCMSATDAQKVSASDLFRVFGAIQATNKALSTAACRVFRDKLMDWAATNMPTGLASLSDVGQQLFLKDVTTIPPCVIVSMGNIALQVLNAEMKQVLLMQMCKNSILSTIPRNSRRLFINSIFGNMVSAAGAKVGVCELNILNDCAFDLSPYNLKKMDEFASFEFIKRLQKAFLSAVPPCLDQSQQQQIGQMLVKAKGPTTTWKNASDISCLLGMLPSTNLMTIPDEVYTSTSCNIMMSPFEDGQLGVCKIGAMNIRDSIAMDQAKRCIKLRQTGGTATACDKISCGGVTVLTTAEIRKFQLQEVKEHLVDLASKDMGMDKAVILAGKVRQLRSQGNLTQEEQTRLGYIYQAFTVDDINNITTWNTPAAKEMIFWMGMMTSMSDEAMTAIRDNVLTNYKSLSSMTSQDLMLLGRVVCYFTQDQINAIPLSAFLDAMRYLGTQDCSGENNGTLYLASRAIDAYNSDNRSIGNWDPATVSEMGLLMGGLSPESLAMMPDRAFSGLTSAGIQSIPPGVLKVIKMSQIKNLTPTTAASISSNQMAEFNSDMVAALQDMLPSPPPGAGAQGLHVSEVVGALTLVLVLV
ncbi:uncharacterized protein [Procambarus clarkii]|uniref:uncharacterized protein isoform X2 n=1 Tax=Procambarus clarkii TaxID=6728 RepID=UPI001E671EEC|nr:uncharacterized protein LOC123772647 [Procambarus clarkii]